MKITYDKDADAVYIYLKENNNLTKTIQVKNEDLCFVDMEWDIPVWVEILNASNIFNKKNIDFLSFDNKKNLV